MNETAEKLSMENQIPVNEKPIKEYGRKESITIEDVLNAIRKYKTESPSELAEKLQCTRMTIYRKLQQIPREQIEAIFKELADSELKPIEMEWDVFKNLPEMTEFDAMLQRSQVCDKERISVQRQIFYVCKYLKLRPRSLTVDKLDILSDLVLKIKNGQIKETGLKSEHHVRMSIRRWFIYHGISGQLLTAKGLGGEQAKGYGTRAMDKLTKEQRKAFMDALRQIVINEGYGNDLAIWESLPKWLYYTGTRIEASLSMEIDKIKWNGDPKDPNTIGKAYVIDKGRHRKGRQKWWKIIMGDLKDAIIKNLESRGNPQQGLLFNGLTYEKVRQTFQKAYKLAGINVHQPHHIWRHTGAQDLLDATDWNYELVGSILGWSDTKTLKECYGKMGEAIRERALKKAMGMPIEEHPKEFKF
jgi:integrase